MATRCPNTNCYVAGDFHTVASNPYAGATTPFIQKGSGLQNDPCPSFGGVNKLCQFFVEDPQSAGNVQNFKPNFIPITRGADVTSVAKPVSPDAYALPPGLKIGVKVSSHP